MAPIRTPKKGRNTVRFDPAKAWPHPVLRPPSYGDDYPRAEFEVDIDVHRVKHSTAVQVYAVFELSDPDLLKLVAQGSARYVLLVKSSRTHFRDAIETSEKEITKTYPAGALSSRTEFSPFLTCTRHVARFSSTRWHSDFAGRSFDLQPGVVLAQDVPKEYWIDTAMKDRSDRYSHIRWIQRWQPGNGSTNLAVIMCGSSCRPVIPSNTWQHGIGLTTTQMVST